jgi:hypothetical protein
MDPDAGVHDLTHTHRSRPAREPTRGGDPQGNPPHPPFPKSASPTRKGTVATLGAVLQEQHRSRCSAQAAKAACRTSGVPTPFQRAAVALRMILEDRPTAARLRPTRISIVRLRQFRALKFLLNQRLAKEPFPMSLLVTVRHVSEDIDLRPIRGRCSSRPTASRYIRSLHLAGIASVHGMPET